MEMYRMKDYFNIPNLLCYFRILLIPIFLYWYINPTGKRDYFIAAMILVLSGISDFLDGFIARKFDMVTDWGKIVDPLADKLTQFSVALVLVYNYHWMFILVAIMFAKDIMLVFASLYLLEKGVKIKSASWWGKVATAYFYVVVIFLIAFYIPGTPLAIFLILSTSFLMFVALVLYAKEIRDIYLSKVKNGKSS